MKIQFSATALSELEALREYLGEISPQGLENVVSAIQSTIHDIPNSISRGRSTPHDEVWEKVIPKYGYIIPYLIHENTVIILRIYNSRRKPLDYDQISKDVESLKQD